MQRMVGFTSRTVQLRNIVTNGQFLDICSLIYKRLSTNV